MNNLKIWPSVTVTTMMLILAYRANAQTVAAPSGPETDIDTLAEITVTAQKRSQNLQDVPIAITAVSGDELRAANLVSTTDLPTLVSGLAIAESGADYLPHLRGVGTTSVGPGVENPVATYIDGVYYGMQLPVMTDMADVSAVDVIKGPQGTLFGRNATAGVIQFTTRDPQQEFSGQFDTSLDNYLTSRNYLFITDGLTPDLASSISIRYTTQGDGWGRNIANGTDIDRINKDIAARNKWIYTPLTDTTIRLNLDYSEFSNSFGSYSPVAGTLGLIPGTRTTDNPWDVDVAKTTRYFGRQGGASIELERDVGFAKVSSLSAYRQYSWSISTNTPLSPTPGVEIDYNERGEQLTEELQLVSNGQERVQWATGIYFYRAEQSLDPQDTKFTGFLAPTPFSLGTLQNFDTTLTESAAVFAQATIEITSALHLTAGVRDTWEERQFWGSESGFLVNGASIGLLAPYFQESTRVQLPSYRMAIDYKMANGWLAYASYNRSFKSGGFNALNPTNPAYQPEILNAYEVGLKTEMLDRKMVINLAPFYYDYKNIQVDDYRNQVEVIYNGAAAKLYGLDLDSKLKTGPFQLTATAEWLHSSFTSFPLADFSTPLPMGGLVVFKQSAEGNQLPYAPTFTVNTNADYFLNVGPGTTDLRLSNSWSHGYYSEPDNYLRQPAYDFVGASVGWTSSDERFNVKLWGNNLLNRFVSSALLSTAPLGYAALNDYPPRTYGASMEYRFGHH